MNKNSKDLILQHLREVASKDEVFATKFDEEKVDACCRYIMERAKRQAGNERCLCVDDETVFGWAMHYFDEQMYLKDNDVVLVPTPIAVQTSQIQETKLSSQKLKLKKIAEAEGPKQLSLFDISEFDNEGED